MAKLRHTQQQPAATFKTNSSPTELPPQETPLLDDLDNPSTVETDDEEDSEEEPPAGGEQNVTASKPNPVATYYQAAREALSNAKEHMAKAWSPAPKKCKSGQPCNQKDCPGHFRTLTSGFKRSSKFGKRKVAYTRLICDTCKHKEDG